MYFFFFFDLRLLFLCYSGWFKGVAFRFRCIFIPFSPLGFFFYVTPLGLRASGLCSDIFYSFFDLRLPFVYYRAWFKGVGFRFRSIFFVLRPEASFSILLGLV